METNKTFPKLLKTEAAAALLDVAPGTLGIWRCTNRYRLSYVRVGRLVRYLESDILRFIKQRRVGPNKRNLSMGKAPIAAGSARHADNSVRVGR